MAKETGDEQDDYSEEMNQHLEQLVELFTDYAEENELDNEELVSLLMETTLTITTLAYVTGVAKPSAAGLRQQLDQLHTLFGDSVNERKTMAEPIVESISEMVAQAGLEEDRRDG